MFNIIIKNIYEGKYEVTGNMVDDASAALTGYLPMEYHLITSGANVVDGYSPIIGGIMYQFLVQDQLLIMEVMGLFLHLILLQTK